ncbi:helix-turn-helix domain-containing protein [Nocardia carnea]|uniref:Helix-turn-helix domain-containing protein n=1 Tax=Nocardia carnea TaxID=37328 RepID=A0ABW7TEK5_9NOCA|nr:helix-turn-helix transcriptional regulator [Nocardia carnea]
MTEPRRLIAIPGGRDEPPRRQPAEEPEPLWREVLGSRLRALRNSQRETLAETAQRAGISPQYLSEVERGRKEPSSEMIAALAGALGTSLGALTQQVAHELRFRSRPAAERPGAQVPMLRAA